MNIRKVTNNKLARPGCRGLHRGLQRLRRIRSKPSALRARRYPCQPHHLHGDGQHRRLSRLFAEQRRVHSGRKFSERVQ